MIGVGRAHWFELPLPPNRTCGFPASGSPVGGLTCERTDEPRHGLPASYRAQARQSRRWASVIDRRRALWHSLSDDFVCAVRLVFARIVSLSFWRLLLRGQRRPALK